MFDSCLPITASSSTRALIDIVLVLSVVVLFQAGLFAWPLAGFAAIGAYTSAAGRPQQGCRPLGIAASAVVCAGTAVRPAGAAVRSIYLALRRPGAGDGDRAGHRQRRVLTNGSSASRGSPRGQPGTLVIIVVVFLCIFDSSPLALRSGDAGDPPRRAHRHRARHQRVPTTTVFAISGGWPARPALEAHSPP